MPMPVEAQEAVRFFDTKFPELSDKKTFCFKYNNNWTIVINHSARSFGENFLYSVDLNKKKIQPFTMNPIVAERISGDYDKLEMFKFGENDYLEHHGIKGQKWGVRNGPPYPLKENAHSTSEKVRTGSKDKTAQGAEVLAVELAVYATIIAAAAISAKKADARRTKQFDEEYYQQRKIKTLSECPKIDPSSMTMDEHMESINPGYPGFGTTSNCMFCTTAMAMRMKGYDVSAETCPNGWSSKNLASTFKDAKSEEPKCKSTAELANYLKSQGDGAYGNLMVYWSLGGGHSLFYHVDNGEVKIYDTQANKTRSLRDFNGVITTRASEITRLDNVEPTEMVLGCVKQREEKKK